jgi:hypothetical protein
MPFSSSNLLQTYYRNPAFSIQSSLKLLSANQVKSHRLHSINMPLVVPGLQSKGSDDKTNKWMNDLVGKKIGDSSNETVCVPVPLLVQQR